MPWNYRDGRFLENAKGKGQGLRASPALKTRSTPCSARVEALCETQGLPLRHRGKHHLHIDHGDLDFATRGNNGLWRSEEDYNLLS